jgi:pyridinium-3,5-bisthiocarboxylic acid mononucleotide nickel chelatase
MRIAYLDCFSGMSGDMFLGALVDAGVPGTLLEDTVAALNLGARIEIGRVMRGGISATKVDVYVNGEKELPREVFWEKQKELERHQEHSPVELKEHNFVRTGRSHGQDSRTGVSAPHEQKTHGQDSRTGMSAPHEQVSHGQDSPTGMSAPHEQAPHEPASHRHEHGRGLKEISHIIAGTRISETSKQTALAIFQELGEAEARIHNIDIERVHFHEVGAVDALVDIVCAAVGVEALEIDEIVCSPLNVGGGTVKCAHGTLPVPAPATVELLKDAPVYSSGAQVELVTPTGAAIVKVLAKRFAGFPKMKIEKAGYGAGSRDLTGQPNVMRLTIGEAQGELAAESITVLEANLDDLNPQVFGYVIEKLLGAGALDVFGVPVQMKKNRPGMVLTVLAKPEEAGKMEAIIFSETTTLGVRNRTEERRSLARKWVNVSTQWGEVRIKVASLNGTVTNYAPEYEDCRKLAEAGKVPLKEVMQEAVQSYLGRKE